MLFISQALGSATKTIQMMRTSGQLQERLRGGNTVVRRDLAQDHYGPPYTTYQGPKVANQKLHLPGWSPPEGGGYFEIRAVGPMVGGNEYKGNTLPEPYALSLVSPVIDSEGLHSTRAAPNTDPNLDRTHMMRFTVRLPAGPPSELFSAQFEPHPRILGNLFINEFPDQFRPVLYSRWAEVSYFLVASNETAGVSGAPLYALHRRVRLLAPKGIDIFYENNDPTTGFPVPDGTFTGPKTPSALIPSMYPDVATREIRNPPTTGPVVGFRILGADDLSDPAQRLPLPLQPAARLGVPTGGDLLMTDVISFEVRAAWIHNPEMDLPSTANDYAGYSPNPTRFQSNPSTLGTTHPSLFTDGPFYDLPRSTVNLPYTQATQAVAAFDTWGPVIGGPPTATSTPVTLGDTLDWNDRTQFLQVSPLLPPLRINVRAVQIKIRIWDPRAEQARQVTIVQEI
jgi:hypothetical protein